MRRASADEVSEAPPRYTRRERAAPLPFSTKLFQGIGAIPDTVKDWTFKTFLLLYYSQVLGVEAFQVSLALAVAVVFDAVTDPLLASLSDDLQSRWGRRHPLMLLGGLPLGLAFYAVFVPPAGLGENALVLWLLAFTVLTRGLMTLYFIPWAAIAAELSDDYHERTSVMTYRFAVGWTVGVSFPFFVFTVLMPGSESQPVGQLDPSGYPAMALVGGLLMTAGALLTTLLTLREVPYLRQPTTSMGRLGIGRVAREVRLALGNHQFALIFVIVLMVSALGGTTANIGIYMTTFFWGLDTADLRWFVIAALGAVLAFPIVAALQRRFDKKSILLSCAIVSLLDGMILVSLRFADVLPANGDPKLLGILIGAAIFAAAVAVVQGIVAASVVADVLDDQELRTGHRQEAMFNAALSFSGKAVSGVGIVFGGMILSLIDFPRQAAPGEVPAEAITRLGIVLGLVVPTLYLVPIALITRYRITREAHAEIRAALDTRHGRRAGC